MSKFQSYLLNKVFWFLLAFCIALSLNFFLPRMIPGNPVDVIIGQMALGGGISGQALEKVHAAYIEEFGDASLTYSHGVTTNPLVGQSLVVDDVRLRGALPLLPQNELVLAASAGYQHGRHPMYPLFANQ